MAYLERIATEDSYPIVAAPVRAFASPRLVPAPPGPEFSPLEWSVIRRAESDRLWTLREPGPLRRFINWVTGLQTSPAFANPRLEALRLMAVLSWHYGFVVPGDEVAEFGAAGFSDEQYELMVSSISAAIASETQRNGR